MSVYKIICNQHAGESGKIEVITGNMFAGKTTEMISRLLKARKDGSRVIAFKLASDSRYNRGALASHDGETFKATLVDNLEEIWNLIDNFEIIGFDEAHFFGNDLIDIALKLKDFGKRVIISGIFFDIKGQPISPCPDLSARQDVETTKLYSKCAQCENIAHYHQRLTPVTNGFLGGSADYEPRCRQCFVPFTEVASTLGT